MSPVTKLVLWRHGVTDWNERGVFQGQTDVPLNDRGLKQAVAAAPRLAAFGPEAIVSSPMLRARQTAAALAELVAVDVVVDDRMSEINVGTWTGQSMADVMADDPSVLAAVRSGKDYQRSATGETMTQVGARAGQCLRQVALDHAGRTAVVVSHSGAIRMGVASLLGWSHATATGLGGVGNCAWVVVAQRHGTWRIETYNCGVDKATPGDI